MESTDSLWPQAARSRDWRMVISTDSQAARRCQRPATRRLADDPLWHQNHAGNRRHPHDTRIAALVARRRIKREFGVCLKTGPRFGSHKQVQSDARIIVHRNPGIRDTEHLGYRPKDFLNRRAQRGKPQPRSLARSALNSERRRRIRT
jgi:hypothetical protein